MLLNNWAESSVKLFSMEDFQYGMQDTKHGIYFYNYT